MNARRVRAIARNEARAHLGSPLLWGLVMFAAFATLTVNPAAMIPTGDSAVGGVRPFSNSRYAMAQSFALSGLLFYTFLTSILAGLSVPRDEEARVGDLIHSTPLTAGEYITGKFCGVLAALGGAVLLHVTLAATWYEGAELFGSDALRGPFRASNYVAPALVFLAPGVLFCAGLAFAAGERSRSSLAVYAVPTALFAVALGGLIPRPASSLDGLLDPFFAIFDPWGARWLSRTIFHVDRGVEFYNTAPLVFDSSFLLNRLFVVSMPILAVLGAARHRGRVVRGVAGGPARVAPVPVEAPPPPVFAAPRWRELGMISRPPGLLGAAWEMARVELVQIRSQPGVLLFVLFAMLLTLESAGSARGVFDSQVILTSGGLAVNLVEVVSAMGCLLLLFHVVESLDRGRRLGAEALVESTPVSNASILLGTLLSGGLLVSFMLAGCGLVALALVGLQDRAPVEAWPFALVWGALLGPTFVFWSAAVAAVFALARDRYATYVIGLAGLMGTAALLLSGSMTWVTNWPLWGALRWSDFGVFELDREALWLNRLTVTGASAAFMALALWNWPRVEPDALRSGGRGSPGRLARRAARSTLLAFLVLVPALVLSARIDRGSDGKAARAEARDYWRRNSAAWSGVTPPAITHVDVKVDLEPSTGSMRIAGAYAMLNDTGAAVARLPFTVGPGTESVTWTIDGEVAKPENRAGLHLLTLAPPRPAGEGVRVGFAYRAVVPRGITRNGGGAPEFIRPSGVLLSTLDRHFLPLPGFVEGVGVDRHNRAEPAELPEESWRADLPPIIGSTRPFTSRMEVTAPAEYIVNGVGNKTRETTANGRTTVVWESEQPVRFLNLVAGRWSVRRREGVAVYHHSAHHHNVDEIVNALAAARRRYSEWFRPYPWKELRLSEHADHVTRAQGFPSNIPFSEGMGFLTRSDEGVGLPAIIAAHETAHQWWGHLVTAGRAPGADVLIEGMAHYSTLLFLDVEHGAAARKGFAISLEARYADERRADAERPLARIVDTSRATDETAIYDKGAWVMWMLQERLGREAMLAGLRSFIRRFEGSRDHPAVQDLIEELRPLASSPVEFEEFVGQWFFDVVIPEFQVSDASARRTSDGWLVAATVENVGTGRVTVEVAAVQGPVAGPEGPVFAESRQEARVRIPLTPGRAQRVTWRASFAPETIVVDPDAMVLQLNRARARAVLGAGEKSSE
jgi:ABC-type transport system involved in multi-copper enzyme maturation permease subunit